MASDERELVVKAVVDKDPSKWEDLRKVVVWGFFLCCGYIIGRYVELDVRVSGAEQALQRVVKFLNEKVVPMTERTITIPPPMVPEVPDEAEETEE